MRRAFYLATSVSRDCVTSCFVTVFGNGKETRTRTVRSVVNRQVQLCWSALRIANFNNFSLLRVVPESPRWAFLNSSTKDGTSEAQVLLDRLVNEEQRQSSKYRNCLNMWGNFHFPAEAKTRGRCFTFLRRKKQRKITIVLGVAW